MAKENNNQHHNDGQSDGANNEYNPPHQRVGGVLGEMLSPLSEDETKDRDDYETGRQNAKK